MACVAPALYAQNIVVDGVTLANAGGSPTNCSANSYKLKGTAAANGSCVSLTSNTFDAGALWVCDPINLNESFKVYFEANFDSFNSGDGIAFVLQNEGVPTTLGAEAGGIGYSLGNLTGCIPFGDCIISPSVTVELDIWDNSGAVWDVGNPGLGTINDISCDHASIQTNGVQLMSNALVPPTCLLPSGVDVTDGLNHDVCIIWDVVNLQYSVYFDSALVVVYNGDIRTNFVTPASVFWGFTAGSGGATQNQRVCNVDMLTNIANPFCTCTLPIASALPTSEDICSGNTTNISLSSTVAGTTYDWVATDNINVSGESTISQSGATIAETLTNNSSVDQTVIYTVTPDAAGCIGSDIIVSVIVHPTPVITNTLTTFDICSGGAATITPTSDVAGTTFGWAAVGSSGNVSGFSASGSGNISEVLTNSGTITETVTYTITPTGPATSLCPGLPVNFIVTVYPTPVITNAPTTSDICSGETATIIPTSNVVGTTYGWTAVGSSGNVSGYSASGSGNISEVLLNSGTGIETVTYSVTPTGPATSLCLGLPVDFVVNVYPSPVISGVGTDPSTCATATGNIEVTLISGLTSSGTLTWTGTQSGNNSTADVTLDSPDIGSLLAGGYSVSFVDANGCASNNVALSLDDPFAPIFTNTIFTQPSTCGGSDGSIFIEGTGTLLPSTNYNLTYNYGATVLGPLVISTDVNGDYLLTGLTAGSYSSITMELAGCVGSQVGPLILVDPTPPVASAGTSTANICEGSDIVLLGNTVAGATYSWTGPNTFSDNIEDPIIVAASVLATGTYSLTITLNNCVSIVSTVDVIVNQMPILTLNDPVAVCSPSTVDITVSGVSSTTAGSLSYFTDPGFLTPVPDATQVGAGTYYVLATNAGCSANGSVVVMINNSNSGSENVTACDSYTWPANTTTYTSSGSYTTTLTNAVGCDSVATLNLTINYSNSGSENVTACDSYTWPANTTTYASSGSYTATLTNAAGCDSIATLNLTINSVDNGATQIDDLTIDANAVGATYQWLDCDDNYSILTGETSQSFIASINGNYAVEVTQNGCTDTSTCIAITNVGLLENDFGSNLVVYPNPTSGKVVIELGKTYEAVDIKLINLIGQELYKCTMNHTDQIELEIDAIIGYYIIEIETSTGKKARVKVLKE